MKPLFFVLLSSLLTGGCAGEGGADGPCADLCGELVAVCAFAAFPDMGSCLDGCAFDASQGQDVIGQAICVENAACDTFAILECENDFGE
jgi:hypothetical protein